MAISLKPVNEQVIVITGASSGIGLATAELAAEQGAKLVLAARSGETLDEVAARLSQNGTEAMAVDATSASAPTSSRSRWRRSNASGGSTPGSTTPGWRSTGGWMKSAKKTAGGCSTPTSGAW